MGGELTQKIQPLPVIAKCKASYSRSADPLALANKTLKAAVPWELSAMAAATAGALSKAGPLSTGPMTGPGANL